MAVSLDSSGIVFPNGFTQTQPIFRVARYNTGYLGDGHSGQKIYIPHTVAYGSAGPSNGNFVGGSVIVRTLYWVRWTAVNYANTAYFNVDWVRAYSPTGTSSQSGVVQTVVAISKAGTSSYWPNEYFMSSIAAYDVS